MSPCGGSRPPAPGSRRVRSGDVRHRRVALQLPSPERVFSPLPDVSAEAFNPCQLLARSANQDRRILHSAPSCPSRKSRRTPLPPRISSRPRHGAGITFSTAMTVGKSWRAAFACGSRTTSRRSSRTNGSSCRSCTTSMTTRYGRATSKGPNAGNGHQPIPIARSRWSGRGRGEVRESSSFEGTENPSVTFRKGLQTPSGGSLPPLSKTFQIGKILFSK